MKKFYIIYFMLLFLLSCTTKEVPKKDPLIDAYKVSKDYLRADVVEQEKNNIRRDLNFFLNKYDRHWSRQDREKFVKIIYCGEHEFKIEYKIILALISVESQYDIYAAGKNKKKKTNIIKSIDWGLTQQNSKYYKGRYKATESYLDYYHIKYTDSKFDMGKNIFSCFMLLRDTSDFSDLIHFKDLIASYNAGTDGVKREWMKKRVDEYYGLFMQELLSI